MVFKEYTFFTYHYFSIIPYFLIILIQTEASEPKMYAEKKYYCMLQSKSWILKGWKRVAIFFAVLLLWLWDLCMRNNHKIRLMDTEDKRWMARSSHSRKKPEPETKTMAAIICVWPLWDKRKNFENMRSIPRQVFHI